MIKFLWLKKNDSHIDLAEDFVSSHTSSNIRTQMMRCSIYHTSLSLPYIRRLYVRDGLRYVAQLMQSNECVLGIFKLDFFTRMKSARRLAAKNFTKSRF